jgi:hypothetical protein
MLRNSSRKWTIGCKVARKSISRLFQHSYLASTKIAAPSSIGASNSDRVRLSFVDGDRQIVKVELSRPSKLNSLDMAMFEAIAAAASKLQNDRSIRAVILSGEGRAFCTGLDVVRGYVVIYEYIYIYIYIYVCIYIPSTIQF